MPTVIDILEERGFIEQKTHEAELDEYIQSGEVSCYIGFDPTASSLHIGQPRSHYGIGAYAESRSQTCCVGRWWNRIGGRSQRKKRKCVRF